MRKWSQKEGRDYHNFLYLRRPLEMNVASSDTQGLPIERFKIMEKEIDIFGNLLMTMN
jgi:hypothetical protein